MTSHNVKLPFHYCENPSTPNHYNHPDSPAAFCLRRSQLDASCFIPRSRNIDAHHIPLVHDLGDFARRHFHCLQRPVQGEKRVTPSKLRNYRESHQFLGPCCLCPFLEPLKVDPRFTEAAIYMPVHGRYAGEYVAECAESRCGYIGWSAFAKRIEERCSQTMIAS